MNDLTARSAGLCFLLIVLLAMYTGCASPNRQARKKALPEVRVLQSGRAQEELNEDLSQFLDYAESEITATADQIEALTQDVGARKAALSWKSEFTQATANRSSQKTPMALLMDAWVFCIRQTNYLQSGVGKSLFRDQQPLAIQAAIRVQNAAKTVALKYIAADELPDVIRELDSHARAHPMLGVFEYGMSESFSAGQNATSVLSRIFGVAWYPFKWGRDSLDPTSSGAKSLDRFTDLMANYPALVRWQAHLLWLELENSRSFRTTMRGIESFSQNSECFLATAEALPQQLREELRLALDDIDGRQPELRKTLAQARATVDAALARAETVSATVERSVEGVTRAAEAVTNTFKQIHQLGKPRADDESPESDAADPASGGVGSTNNQKKSFDIAEYTQSAEALTRSTAELRDLLSEVRSFLSSETLEQDLSRVVPLTKAAFAQTIADIRGVVDHLAWRAVQLCGLVLLLAVIYRFLAVRYVVRPPAAP